MEIIEKTGYEWCLEAKMRLLNIKDWVRGEKAYYEDKIDAKTFYEMILNCIVKSNSTPRKSEMYLRYRMYGLVPYNISDIQKSIQYGHAVVEYRETIDGIKNYIDVYKKWAKVDKTFIILNGGTTNNTPSRLGTLNKHMETLRDNGIQVQEFYEPDLNDALTAVVFLVDERVFDRELYPDFVSEPFPWPRKHKPSEKQMSIWESQNNKNYSAWVEKIGGEKNAFLRDFLRNFKLA